MYESINSLIVWITFKCNFYCPYCVTKFRVQEERFSVDRTAQEWIDALSKFKEGTIIDFTGGEPLIFYGFSRIVEELSKTKKIALTTNLSLANVEEDWWKKLSFLTVSYHPSMMRDEFQRMAFWEKVRILKSRLTIPITVNLVATKHGNQIGIMEEFTNTCKEIGVKPHIDPCGEEKFSDAEQEELRKFVQTDRRVNEAHDEILKNDRFCSAGRTYIQILPDGGVVPCFGLIERGNIFKGTFKPLDKDVLCTHKVCGGCDYDAVELTSLEGKQLKKGK